MIKVALLAFAVAVGAGGVIEAARADDLPCVSTTIRFIGKNDRVCVSAFDDPKVAGVACHVSQARTGGLSGTIGLAEDPSRFSIACRQIGPITVDVATLTDGEQVYSARTSIFFKDARLSHGGQEAEHARLPRHQRQAHRGFSAEQHFNGADHAVGRGALGIRGLESHADQVALAPDDRGLAPDAGLDIHQREPVGNGNGRRHLQPGTTRGHVADGAVDAERAARKHDLAALEHPLTRALALVVDPKEREA
jgi:catabolite regulation protein CreA